MTAKRGRGQPTKLTPEVQIKIIEAVKAGNHAEVAAQYAGIGERTFYRWKARGEEDSDGIYRQFWLAIKEAEAQAEVYAVAIVRKHMADNWQAAMTYLERKHPKRWARTERTELTGKDGGPVQTQTVMRNFFEGEAKPDA